MDLNKYASCIFYLAFLLVVSCNSGGQPPPMIQNGEYQGVFSPGIYNSTLSTESFNLTISSPYSTFTNNQNQIIISSGIFYSNNPCFAGITTSTIPSLNNQLVQFINCSSNSNSFSAEYQIVTTIYGVQSVIQQGSVFYLAK